MRSAELLTRLEALRVEGLQRIRDSCAERVLEQARIEVLGRKSPLSEILRLIGSLPKEERAKLGAVANETRDALAQALEERKRELVAAPKATAAGLDVTLPGLVPEVGSRHPIYQVAERMIRIFHNLGFSVVDGPEVEDEFHNFIGLNIPPGHIARDPSENFYLDDDLLLRSQTSTVQVRVMKSRPPPLRVVAPGKVYRPDTVDASHSFMFHQIEGLMVGEGVTLGDLKATLLGFFRQMFAREPKLRLRPSFFPFTEPSAEIDLSCPFCGGSGCKVCKRTGWMEMGGCGMVDPNVFTAVGYDPERYTGFAFGMGIDRLTMSYYDIPDIRYLFENDVRFLEQFAF